MTGRVDYVNVGAATVRTVTDKAVLVTLDDDRSARPAKYWFPQSMVSEECLAQCERGISIGRFRVQRWIADSKNLKEVE